VLRWGSGVDVVVEQFRMSRAAKRGRLTLEAFCLRMLSFIAGCLPGGQNFCLIPL
jgi:hypothetical protein